MDSFSLPEQRPTYSQETAAPVTPQVGLVGGAIKGGLQLRDPSKDTPGIMDSLFNFAVKIGDRKFAEWEAKRKDEAFVAGMGRAAQGEAAVDIEANQPWYASVFGGGDVVKGARAWEGITDANQLEVGVISNMKSLRELPPEQAQAALLEMRDKMKSGDPTRDAANTAMFVKALPGVLKMHAKEHTAYNQEVATEAQRKGIQSSMNSVEARMQAFRSLDNVDESDKAAVQADLRATFQVPKGVNPTTYGAQLAEGMANSMAMGKFETYTQAQELGLLGNLPKQYAKELERLHDTEARKVAYDRAPAHLKSRLQDLAGADAATTATMVDAINADFKQSSGLDIPLIPGGSQMTMVQQAARRDEAKAEAAARKAEREGDAAAKKAAAQDEKDAKAATKRADEQAISDGADAMVDKMLDDPREGSVKVITEGNKGQKALKLAGERLGAAAAARWDSPKLEPGEAEALAQITDPTQKAAQQAALEAKARHKLLSKPGVPLQHAREQIKMALDQSDYMAGTRVIQALAYGAEGKGMAKLPENFTRVVPEEHQAMMTAYVNEIGAVQGKDGKAPVYDYAALWAAAEAKTRLSAKKPPSKAQMAALAEEVKAQATTYGEAKWAGLAHSTDTQALSLLKDVAIRTFDGRVSSDNLTPHGAAIARAKEQIEVFAGTGIGVLKNGKHPTPMWAPQYVSQLGKDSLYLDASDKMGTALKDAAEARGVPLEQNSRVYRADDTPNGRPYFVVLGNGPGSVEVITMADMLAAAKKRRAKEFPAAGEAVAPVIIAP